MLLIDFAEKYAMRSGASAGYAEQLRVFTKRLPWRVDQITQDMVDEYLTSALTKLSPQTVANHRRMLTTLMKEARRQKLNTRIRKRFRRVKTKRPLVRAWSLKEIGKLIEVARAVPGTFRGGVSHADFLVAWFLAGYCTGLRAGDLRRLRWDQVSDGRAYVMQNKTSNPHVTVFTDEAIAALNALPRKGPLVFGGFAAKKTIQTHVKKCVEAAGLSGSTKWLRRSCATYAKICGFSPKARLGHLSDGLAERCYVDQLLYEVETGANSQPLPSVIDAKK